MDCAIGFWRLIIKISYNNKRSKKFLHTRDNGIQYPPILFVKDSSYYCCGVGGGGRHSSVESSAPTIVKSRVRIPSTISTHFQFVLLKLDTFLF